MINAPKADTETEIVIETVRGAVAGDDAPMETEHKVATAALVGATYPIVLVVLLIIGLVVAYFTAWRGDDASGRPAESSAPEVFR